MAIIAATGIILLLTILNIQASSDTLWTAKYIDAAKKKEAAYYEAASACKSILPYIKSGCSDKMTAADFCSALSQIQSLSSSKIDTGTSKISIEIYDAESRFPINSCTDDIHIGMLARLLDSIGMDSSYAGAVADWIDSDSDPRAGGSESSHYGRNAKNAPLDSIDELNNIYGIKEAIDSYSEIHEEGFEALRLYLYAGPVKDDEMKKVNINTASSAVIKSLSPELTDLDVSNIEAARPIENWQDFIKVAGSAVNGENATELQSVIKYQSRLFIIKARAEHMGETAAITALSDNEGKVLSWKAE